MDQLGAGPNVDREYYLRAVSALYTRDHPLILGLYLSTDATPCAITMVDLDDARRVTLLTFCAAPSKHTQGVEFLRVLRKSRNVTLSRSVDQRWQAESMWMGGG